MTGPDQPSVTILGAGMVGICTALSLAERGIAVRLVDRGAPGQETSFGNAGVVSPASFIPIATPGLWTQLPRYLLSPNRALRVRPAFWPRMLPWGLKLLRAGTETRLRQVADGMEMLCAPSIELYRKHLLGTGAEHLIRDSIYVHAFRDAGKPRLDALEHRIHREKGVSLEIVGRDRLAEIEPALSPAFKAAVLLHDQARALSPGGIGQALAGKARGLGVEILKAEVRGLAREAGGWRIATEGASLRAERVVLAMGAWSAPLLRMLGLSIPLVAERGYHIECPAPGVELRNSVMDVDTKCVASSMEGGLRMAGQAEFGGLDDPPDPTREAHMARLVSRMIPGIDVKGARVWMGRRPSLPDSLPVIGALPGQEGLFGCFGHAHWGLMQAPKSGEILADLLTGRLSNTDLSAFSATRF